jgi:hypothetical protein
MSDLEASTTNSGGRKARPYDGQVNPFGRGGVYPARKEPIVPLIPALESLNLDSNFRCHMGSRLLADKHTKGERR